VQIIEIGLRDVDTKGLWCRHASHRGTGIGQFRSYTAGIVGPMVDTAARLLRLLSLLQARQDWSGAALAERLGVTTRTVRRDIERLRELGYPVQASMGPAGGYRLGAGAVLPPLLLDDEEAVAVVVGLRTGVAGIDEASLRALGKVEQVLPSRLRRRVNTLESAMIAMPPRTRATIDPTVLTAISEAIRASETLRFHYLSHHETQSQRAVQPHRLVAWGHRWYLLGWDVDRRLAHLPGRPHRTADP